MPSSVDRALALAAAAHAKAAGQAITYIAGSNEIEIADAVLGQTIYESETTPGIKVRSNVIDWLVLIPRLVDDATPIEPAPGHRIVQAIDGVTRTFEVSKLDGEDCYVFSGPSRDRFRIHTREIPN